MSRILVFDATNRVAGELSARVDRGWMITGNPSVTGGGSTTLTLSEAQASKPYWQFGRMIMIVHPKLPVWVGMIDPPWNVAPPVSLAAYNAEYLLSLRAPEETSFFTGAVGEIAGRMLEKFNQGEDLFVRLGDTARADPTPREETLDGRTYWEQLVKLLERSGCEMTTRAVRDADGRLIVYLDIAQRLGEEDGFLFSDGLGGNATFDQAVIDSEIVNRVVGIGDEISEESRLRTPPFQDTASSAVYRMRSRIVQFRDVREQATLNRYAEIYLASRASPRFQFAMRVQDQGEAFQHIRLGNVVMVHFARAILPGGVRGWRGRARILAMAYDEASNTLTAQMETV